MALFNIAEHCHYMSAVSILHIGADASNDWLQRVSVLTSCIALRKLYKSSVNTWSAPSKHVLACMIVIMMLWCR